MLTAIVTNAADVKWIHEANDPPGSESLVLREDSKTGALELLVRYPTKHVFEPHWHSANERIIAIEGRLSLRQGDTVKFFGPRWIRVPAGRRGASDVVRLRDSLHVLSLLGRQARLPLGFP